MSLIDFFGHIRLDHYSILFNCVSFSIGFVFALAICEQFGASSLAKLSSQLGEDSWRELLRVWQFPYFSSMLKLGERASEWVTSGYHVSIGFFFSRLQHWKTAEEKNNLFMLIIYSYVPSTKGFTFSSSPILYYELLLHSSYCSSCGGKRMPIKILLRSIVRFVFFGGSMFCAQNSSARMPNVEQRDKKTINYFWLIIRSKGHSLTKNWNRNWNTDNRSLALSSSWSSTSISRKLLKLPK